MNRKYAPRLFMVMLALFWLSLLLTVGLRPSSAYNNEITLSYKELNGIESVHFDNRFWNQEKSHINLEICYVNQPHISVEFRGIHDETVVNNLFDRDGNRLIFHPEIIQENKNKDSNDDFWWWNVKKINLPLHIQKITTQGIGLEIDGKSQKTETDNSESQIENETHISLPQLDIDAAGDSIDINHISIGKLKIRHHAPYTLCPDGVAYTYGGEEIKIRSSAGIEHLLIESRAGKNIALNNTAAIKNMALYTSPETGIELDRIDAYQRLNWMPVPPLKQSDIRPDIKQRPPLSRPIPPLKRSDIRPSNAVQEICLPGSTSVQAIPLNVSSAALPAAAASQSAASGAQGTVR